MTRLPASLEQLGGLRAARWIRESTRAQGDRFGPDAQREQQDRAIERHGLRDVHQTYEVAHSGRTIAGTPEWAAMIAAAGVDWDVLVVGYVSRFARDLRTAVNARHDLHAVGAVILFADERILSSDEAAWDAWAREAVEAEAYSRRLSRRVREGFAAKRRRERDQGSGEVSVGFHRVRGILEVDPETMPIAVKAYELSARGATDREVAATTGMTLWQVRTVLNSGLYAGRLADGTETRWPAPVPFEVIEAATLERQRRSTSGHTFRHRIYPLTDRGPLVCAACDRPLHGVTRTATSRRVYRHPDRCDAWSSGEAAAVGLEDQVGQLLAGARPTRESAARIRAALRQPAVEPDRIALARIDAEMRRVALALVDHADPGAIARLEQLRTQRAVVAVTAIAADQPDPERALAYLEDLGRLWKRTDDEGRRALVVANFERLGAIGARIVDVAATPAAARRGLVLALPTRVSAVGGTGEVQTAPTFHPVVIADRDAWLRAARSA